MAATEFSLGANVKAKRKLLVTCVKVGGEWEVEGAGVEDSSIEFNPDTETITDILGITETTVNKLETSQSLDPMTIRGGSKLAFDIFDKVRYQKLEELSNYEVMIIYAFVNEGKDSSPAYAAEVHKGCTITPQSIGGSAYVDMPVDINYSNDKTHGTVNAYKKGETITFTAAS